jgi:phospholipid transport system substrate-binding protein
MRLLTQNRAMLTGIVALCGLTASQAEIRPEPGRSPNEIINSAATSMAETLDGRRDYFENNPDELYSMVDGVLLPHFDTRYAGRLVLGKHWKGTSNEQRAEFIDAFYEFLMRSYSKGLLQFDQDQVEILSAFDNVDGKRAIVKTSMRLDDGTLVPVNYSMRKSAAGWRVYDVRIEGISYIQNYRNQFNAEIHAVGVDAVIERLRTENATPANPDTAAAEAQ